MKTKKMKFLSAVLAANKTIRVHLHREDFDSKEIYKGYKPIKIPLSDFRVEGGVIKNNLDIVFPECKSKKQRNITNFSIRDGEEFLGIGTIDFGDISAGATPIFRAGELTVSLN